MKLRKRWTKVVDAVAMHVLPMKYYNLLQCSKEGLWQNYFTDAEAEIKAQWDEIIWPLIKDFDFKSVLELAPGAKALYIIQTLAIGHIRTSRRILVGEVI